MNEDFVPFELAKKLQEKGCSVKCLAFYTNVGILHCNESLGPHETYMDLLEMNNNQRGRGIIYDAPTISQALKWLRERKIFISIGFSMCGYHYDVQYNIKNNSDYPDLLEWVNAILNGEKTIFASYEEAAIAGIEYVIDNLI